MSGWTGFFVTYGLLAVSCLVDCLPVDAQKDVNQTNLDSALQFLEKEITTLNTPNRITKIFHLRNETVAKGKNELPRSLFSTLLKEIGWSKVENVVPMYWTEIASIEGLLLKERQRRLKCDEIFHPDHFLSNVILENLINSKSITQEQFTNSMMRVFCHKTMKHTALHFAQSDDVISGLVILSIQNDDSVVALVNVGF